MEHIMLDTNVVIRFLTNDDEEQSPVAFEIFKKAVNEDLVLEIDPCVISECVYVLSSKRYGYSKEIIAENLSKIIESPGVKATSKDAVLTALHTYSNANIDYTDAYLAAIAAGRAIPCLTWNSKHFKKCSNVEHYTPEQILKEQD